VQDNENQEKLSHSDKISMKLFFYLLMLLQAQHLLAQDVDYDLLANRSNEFDRKILNLSGIISDSNKISKEGLEYWTFKLSQTSEVQKYIQVTLYQKIGDTVIENKEYVSGEIIDLEGEFRSNYEITDSKKMGDLYVNMKVYNQSRMEMVKAKQAQSYFQTNKEETVPWATLADMASDFTENSNSIIKVAGVVKSVKYVNDKQGNEYWEIELKDHFESEKIKSSSPYSMVIKYHLIINGTRVAEINLDQFIQVEKLEKFTGKYLYKEKIPGVIGEVELNYLKEDGSYQDYFILKDYSKKSLNQGLVTNSNNDDLKLKKINKP
jgi:hypothetical protein